VTKHDRAIIQSCLEHRLSAIRAFVDGIDFIMENSLVLTEAEQNLLLSDNDRPPLYRFVISGGPCGGKTTALARVFSYLRERGFEVINCPEAYTILNSNGMSFDFFTTGGMSTVIQGTVLDVQIAFEDGVERVLKARGKPAVMLCDRGAMDGSVYVSPEEFEKVMEQRNTNIVQLRDNRYDAVFHMVTAADGAEEYYTLENNKVRHESKEDARIVDQKTQRAWLGHPHLHVIDNSTNFEGKLTRLINKISAIVGLPTNLKRMTTKFLLKRRPDLSLFPSDIHYQIFEVEKVYIHQASGTHSSTNDYSFIRRRSSVDHATGNVIGSVYQITSVSRGSNNELIELKRIITHREYATAFQNRDLKRHIIRQRRISFLYEKQSFNVHMYEAPVADLNILHAQVETSNVVDNYSAHVVNMPPFLSVDRQLENTKEDEENYGAYSLSLIL
jgi:AAA domain